MNYDQLIETETECSRTPRNFNAVIVLVVKCPILEGAANLARAMLSDVLDRVG